MSLADCAMAPSVWRLDALGVSLPQDGKAIEDYGNRIFRNHGFVRRSPTQERSLRELPAQGGVAPAAPGIPRRAALAAARASGGPTPNRTPHRRPALGRLRDSPL